MPTIEISKKDICKLIGKNLNSRQIAELLEYAKASVESEEGDILKVEAADVNRPDLWSSEGLARLIKGQIGKEKGIPKYNVKLSNYAVSAESKVNKARPLIVCAVAKGLNLSKEAIAQIIQLQEKLCENFGLRRKEAALGVYDFDKIKWPITYTTVKPDGIKFIPLEMQQALTPRQILDKHEKGRQYAHLLQDMKEYPLLIDSAKQVLSMPPVINSDSTGKVTEKTKNVFVEVTGSSYRFIVPVLNIMVSALAERQAQIFQVKIKREKTITTPDFAPQTAELDVDYCNKILGLSLKENEICSLLEKARFKAAAKGKRIQAAYLPYRQDIMDSRDLIEDIAIAYDYRNLKPEEASIPCKGKSAEFIKLKEKIIQLLTGLNMQEIATFTLTSKDNLFKRMKLPEQEVIEIANPISANYAFLRNSLLPSGLEFLSQNIKKAFPQKIFEIGECFSMKEQKTKNNLAILITHKSTDFTEIKQVLDYLSRNLGKSCTIKETNHASFIEGRAGSIMLNNRNEGIIGEIHPKVLAEYGIRMPVVALEITLDF